MIERTVELAGAAGGFGPRQLRAALDSSPLWGAGRVEDTYNLLGHALRKALGVIARQQGRGLADVAAEAGADAGGRVEPEGGARPRLGRSRPRAGAALGQVLGGAGRGRGGGCDQPAALPSRRWRPSLGGGAAGRGAQDVEDGGGRRARRCAGAWRRDRRI